MAVTVKQLREVVRDVFAEFAPGAVQRAAEPELTAPRWAVAARLEDDRSDFCAEDRITPATLREFVDTFDETQRRVPIICAQGKEYMGSHWATWLPPTGRVVGIEADRINLWMSVRSFIDPILGLPRLDMLVSDGFTQQSIGFQRGSNETEGKARIFHLAQLSEGEPPGIANMPRWDEMGFGLDAEQLAQLQAQRALHPDSIGGARAGEAVKAAVMREWRSFGGAERAAAAAHELEVRTRLQYAAAFRGEDDKEIYMAADNEELAKSIRELTGELTGQISGLTEAVSLLVSLQPAPMDDEEEEAATEEVTESLDTDKVEDEKSTPAPQPRAAAPRPAPKRAAKPKAPAPAPVAPTPDPRAVEKLRNRATAAVRKLVAAGTIRREHAERSLKAALKAGEDGVIAIEELADEAAASKRAQIFREVQLGDGTEVAIDLKDRRFFSFHGHKVNPQKLELLAIAGHQERSANPNADISPRRLMSRVRSLYEGQVA